VLVPPSLPKWVRGDVGALRASIGQMVEIARIVAFERPLVLTAAQEASKARSVQVRFSIQIPPPKLDGDALETLRACIGGSGKDDGALSGDFSDMVFGDARRPEKAPLELVAADDQAAVLRCSAEFEIAEEAESDQSWVRGLRTLIIQDAATVDNGIQPALGAFGIIGYVVTDEQDLIAALKIAEEYSNPYRLVLADVDTTDLEAFVSHLFDGDAPVVLVGTESESAMVGALSAGYDGYLAKPVRQVDLLEVILSTVEPPQHGSQARAADAA
jgi:CheY-like chemotaxis protein